MALRPTSRSIPGRRTAIEVFGQRGWPGGWQADLMASHVPNDALDFINNVNWLEGFALERRGGFEKITNDVSGQDEAQQMHVQYVHVSTGLTDQPSFTQEVLYYNDDDGEVFYATLGELMEEEQFATGADLVYSSHSIGPWSSVPTNFFRTWNIASIVFEDTIYITALRFGGYSGVGTAQTHDGSATGASKPIKYDVLNNTWSRPTPHSLTGGTTGFPSARCAITTYDRVFVGNLYKMSAYRYPNRIYWSEPGTAETFEANSFITVGADDGSEITNIIEMGEAIFITKDHSCWLLLGTDEDTFELRNVNPEQGARSSQGCVYHQGKVYFFDNSHGLMAYDGANFTNISEPINGFMLSQLNHESDFRVNLKVFGTRLFLSIPTGDGISDTVDVCFIYDMKLQQWTQWDFGIPSDIIEYVTDHSVTGVGMAGTGDAYISTPDGINMGIFRLEGTSGTDEKAAGDAAVSADIHTGWITAGEELGSRHRIRRLDLITSATTTSDIDVKLFRDFEPDTAWQTANYNPDGTLDAWHEQDQGYDHATDMFVWLQLQLLIDQTGTDCKIHGYQCSYSSRAWRRGVQGQLNPS